MTTCKLSGQCGDGGQEAGEEEDRAGWRKVVKEANDHNRL
jgi:hypothetical protein